MPYRLAGRVPAREPRSSTEPNPPMSYPPPRPPDPDADRGGVSWLLYKLWRNVEPTPTEPQLDLVAQFCELYQRYGLINEIGDPLPLYEACRHCESCWHSVLAQDYPDPESAEIMVPWIGSSYFRDRICALAINPNKYGALGGHWWITGGRTRDLRDGKKPGFAYGAGSYLAAIKASVRGDPIEDEPHTRDAVADAWDSAAFQETVKCAPDVGVSKPEAPMWENCPSTYMLDELRLLGPRVLLLIGRGDVAPHVLDLFDERSPIERGAHFERYETQLSGLPLEVFSVNHPSYGNWKKSYPEFLASLRHLPITRA